MKPRTFNTRCKNLAAVAERQRKLASHSVAGLFRIFNKCPEGTSEKEKLPASLQDAPGSSSNSATSWLANVQSRFTTKRFFLPGGAWNLRLLFVVLTVFLCGFRTSQAQVSREYQLKAVFLYNFAQFTEWPTNAFADDHAPIVIGILGTDPFGHTLEGTVKGETIGGHPFVIEHYHRADEIKTCHILFISQSENRYMDEIVRSLKGKSILTVADADGPVTAEVIIRFIVENNKVHFRINQQAAIRANLVLSSRLLRVGEATPSSGRVP